MRIAISMLLLTVVLGCGGKPKPPTVAERPEPNPAPVEPVPDQIEPSEPTATPSIGEQLTPAGAATDEATDVSDLPEKDEGEQEDTSDSSESEGTDTEAAGPPRERFVLLAPGGPLLVDLLVRINAESHSATLARLVDATLAAADVDGDGEPTWEEVANSPRFAYGQFGNLPVEDDDQKAQLIRMYDRNGDGVVNRDELPRFLTRNAGGSRSFSLRSSNEYRGDNRTRSAVRLALDTDWDGAITHHEFVSAPAKLLMQDNDDDEIITLNDFKNAVDQQAEQMSNRRRTTQPDTALLISELTDWGYTEYSLRELYAYGDQLSASDWHMVPQLFAQLDKNQDQELDQDEIEALADVPAHLELAVNFGGTEDTEEGEPRKPDLQIEIKSAELEAFIVAVHRYGNRISMELRDTEIEFFVNEDPSLVDYRQVAQNQFAMLDADQNGYLDDDEFPERLPGYNVPLEGVDQNGDGQVYEEELATFLNLRQATFRSQVRARAADQEDALFTALDTDGDGRLNSREVHRSTERLQTLDRNGDGRLQSHEIPGSMVVGFIRGNPQQGNQLFRLPATTGSQDVEAPRWFRGMDANGDGEISTREFIGPAQKFSELDADGDGFVSAGELPQEDDANAEPTAG